MTDINPEFHNVLIIEDNPAHAHLIIRSFERSSIEVNVFHVSDGEMALDYIFNTGKFEDPDKAPKPDLILLDLKLPKVNGHAVLYNLKNSNELKSIPVIVLTTSDADTDVNNAYENKANSYLTKPIDFKDFIVMVDELARYWLKSNVRNVDKVLT